LDWLNPALPASSYRQSLYLSDRERERVVAIMAVIVDRVTFWLRQMLQFDQVAIYFDPQERLWTFLSFCNHVRHLGYSPSPTWSLTGQFTCHMTDYAVEGQ
jgi:hypothetical protein